MRDGGIRSGERLRPADLEAPWATFIEEPPQDELTPVARDDRELWDGDALLLRRLPEQLAGLPQRASSDAARPGDGDLCVLESSAMSMSINLRLYNTWLPIIRSWRVHEERMISGWILRYKKRERKLIFLKIILEIYYNVITRACKKKKKKRKERKWKIYLSRLGTRLKSLEYVNRLQISMQLREI